MANTPFKLKEFSGFGESTSPIKFQHHRGTHAHGVDIGIKRKRRTKTSRGKKIGRRISDVVEKISDTIANIKKRRKVNKEIKRRTKNLKKSEGTGWSNSRTLPVSSSSKIYR